jgi:hypothetical protein
VPYRFSGVILRCPVTLRYTNCFELAFTTPGIEGDPVKLSPKLFWLPPSFGVGAPVSE